MRAAARLLALFLLQASLLTREASPAHLGVPCASSVRQRGEWRLQHVSVARLRGGAEAPTPKQCSCQFQLRLDRELGEGESVYIVGNVPDLGSWKAHAVRPMRKRTVSDGAVFVKEVDLPAGQDVQYRYLVVRGPDTRDKKAMTWEKLDKDRTIALPADASPAVSRDKFNVRVPTFATYGAAAEELWISGEGERHIGRVDEVYPNSPASRCGLEPGDALVSVGSVDHAYVVQHGVASLGREIMKHEGKMMTLVIERKRERGERVLTMTPMAWDGQGLLGCSLALTPALPGGEECGPAYRGAQESVSDIHVDSEPVFQSKRHKLGSPGDKIHPSLVTRSRSRSSQPREESPPAERDDVLRGLRRQLERMKRSARRRARAHTRFNVFTTMACLAVYPVEYPLCQAYQYVVRPLATPVVRVAHAGVATVGDGLALPPKMAAFAVDGATKLANRGVAVALRPLARLLTAVTKPVLAALPAPLSAVADIPKTTLVPLVNAVLRPPAKLAQGLASSAAGLVPAAAALPERVPDALLEALPRELAAPPLWAARALTDALGYAERQTIAVLFIPVALARTLVLTALRVTEAPAVGHALGHALVARGAPLITIVLSASTLAPLAPARLAWPVVSPVLTLALALVHAPTALLAELSAHPAALLSHLLSFAASRTTQAAGLAATPLTRALTLLRRPLHVVSTAIATPPAIIGDAARRARGDALPAVRRVSARAIKLLVRPLDAMLAPGRAAWRRGLGPALRVTVARPSHAVISAVCDVVPLLVEAGVFVGARVEQACARAIGVPLSVYTRVTGGVLGLWGAQDVVIKWQRGGRLRIRDAKEVRLVASFNAWGERDGGMLLTVVSGGGVETDLGSKVFEGRFRLPPGKHTFNFIVDGVKQCTCEWPLVQGGKDPHDAANVMRVGAWRGIAINTVQSPVALPMQGLRLIVHALKRGVRLIRGEREIQL